MLSVSGRKVPLPVRQPYKYEGDMYKYTAIFDYGPFDLKVICNWPVNFGEKDSDDLKNFFMARNSKEKLHELSVSHKSRWKSIILYNHAKATIINKPKDYRVKQITFTYSINNNIPKCVFPLMRAIVENMFEDRWKELHPR